MKRVFWWTCGLVLPAAALFLLHGASAARERADLLWHHRNLGKAFYENPTTQKESAVGVQESAGTGAGLRCASASTTASRCYAPGKPRTASAELVKAQKQDPTIPHTWFNLGHRLQEGGRLRARHPAARRDGEAGARRADHALQPGRALQARRRSRRTACSSSRSPRNLNPNLAGPHFQLFNPVPAGRAARTTPAASCRSSRRSRSGRKAPPSPRTWSGAIYAEIYDPVEPASRPIGAPAPPASSRTDELAGALRRGDRRAGCSSTPTATAARTCSPGRRGRAPPARTATTPVAESGLEGLAMSGPSRPAISTTTACPTSACVTEHGARCIRNRKGAFEKATAELAAGSFREASGSTTTTTTTSTCCCSATHSALLRNNGEAGFSDETAASRSSPARPWTARSSTCVRHPGGDVARRLRGPRRRGLSRPAGRQVRSGRRSMPCRPAQPSVLAGDFNHDGWPDLVARRRRAWR